MLAFALYLTSGFLEKKIQEVLWPLFWILLILGLQVWRTSPINYRESVNQLFFSVCLLVYFLFQCINDAMQKDKEEMSIGVLDIYGFEIFEVGKMNSNLPNRISYTLLWDLNTLSSISSINSTISLSSLPSTLSTKSCSKFLSSLHLEWSR